MSLVGVSKPVDWAQKNIEKPLEVNKEVEKCTK